MSIPKTTTWVNLAVKNYKDKNLMSANFFDENVLKYQVPSEKYTFKWHMN